MFLRSLGSPAEEVEHTLRTGRDRGGAERATAETSRCNQSRPPAGWCSGLLKLVWCGRACLLLAVVPFSSWPGCYWCVVGPLAGQNCCQRLRSFRPDTHMKPWIIAALICSACAAYAAEDDNKIHPTCVEETTRADVGSITGRPPHTPVTEGFFDRARFQRMKPTAFFINIGRGMTTKLEDLVTVLEAGEIAGAALDVYEQEPLPRDHRLWTLPNVLLTPHMAGHGPYLNDRRFQIMVDNCRAFAAGGALRNWWTSRPGFEPGCVIRPLLCIAHSHCRGFSAAGMRL